MRMYAEILFDREIKKEHYISPGGYEVIAKDEKTIQFDFCQFEGNVSENNARVLECLFTNLDTSSFPESVALNPKDIMRISEFFVFTGEDDEPEIHPVKLLSLGFCVDDEEYEVPDVIVKAANVTDGYENYSIFVLDYDITFSNELIGSDAPSSEMGVTPSVYVIPTVRMEDVREATTYAHDIFHQEEENVESIGEYFEDYLRSNGIFFEYIGELKIPFLTRQRSYLSEKVEMLCI